MDEKTTEAYQKTVAMHIEYSKKFEFFFLAVIIGALSLSVQTFNPDKYTISPYLIYLTWGALCLSFLSGFFRHERRILVIEQDVLKMKYKHSNSDMSELASKLRKLFQNHSYYAYQIQKWSFFFAMFTYILFKITNNEPKFKDYEILALIAFVVLFSMGTVIYSIYIKKQSKA